MRKIIHFFKKKEKQKYISGFDEDMFLDANPDIRLAIKNGQFRNVKHHLMKFGLDEIRRGLRPFHRAHEVFDEIRYLKRFPKVELSIKDGEFTTAFDHFCQIGYRTILEEKTGENKAVTLEDTGSSSPFIYTIETIDRHGIVGWVLDQKEKKGELLLNIYINGRYFKSLISNQVRTDVLKVHGIENCGFSSSLGRKAQEEKAFYVEVKIKTDKEEISLTPKPVLVTDPSAILETFFSIQNFLKKEGKTHIENEIVRKAFSDLISDGRNNYTNDILSASIACPSLSEINSKLLQEKKDMNVDVIVPVYRDVTVTQACIESILNAKGKNPFHIMIINDKSPDADMQEMLDSYVNNQYISVFENDENLGFVKTVNKGMQLSHNDVILLNSDTVVTDHWIDKLCNAASSDETIATVTPMSNSATILSYPKTLIDNALPEGFSPHKLNMLFEKLHRGKVIDLPTAHGFCMYIKRAALDELGYFNEEKYGKGYGEENDFSLRALTMGWRNVAACDTFVAHIGAVSFSSSREELAKKNLEVLNRDYPEYTSMVMRFIAKDPLREVRRKVSKEILKNLHSKYMLFVSHSLGGGTDKAMSDLATLLLDESVAVLVLQKKDGLYTISTYDNAFLLEYDEDEWKILLDDLREMQVFHTHFHHLLGMGWKMLEIPEYLGVAYDFTVHDYMAICPRINLVNESGVYCGEPEIFTCQQCIEKNGIYPGVEEMFSKGRIDMLEWRKNFITYFSGVRHIFVPDEDVAIRMKSHFPKFDFTIRPHPEEKVNVQILHRKKGQKHPKLNVAVIGAISDIKGYYKLKELVKDAQKRSLPIRFIVVGYTLNDEYFDNCNNVVITGKYTEDELYKYIEKYHCDLALFLSVWPETYSYTLSESLKMGLSPVSFDMGAIANRLRKMKCGKLLPLDIGIKELNESLLSYSEEKKKRKIDLGYTYNNILKNYYDL